MTFETVDVEAGTVVDVGTGVNVGSADQGSADSFDDNTYVLTALGADAVARA